MLYILTATGHSSVRQPGQAMKFLGLKAL